MTPTISEFEARGWFLSQEGIDLIASENEGVSTLEDYISCALNMDIRQLTTKGFNKTSEKPESLPTPLVLQVLEVRNIAMPSVNQVEKPRLLSVTFTDGSKKRYKSVESLGRVECIKLHTPPGTKFLVTKPIAIKDQIAILGPGMLKELGGNVQELVQAWRAGKQFLKRFGGKSTNAQEGMEGPPAFVPFKVKAKPTNKDIPEAQVSNKKEKKIKSNDKQEQKAKRSDKDTETRKGKGKTDEKDASKSEPSNKKNSKESNKQERKGKSTKESKSDKTTTPSAQTSTEHPKRRDRSETVKNSSDNAKSNRSKKNVDQDNQKPKRKPKQAENTEEKTPDLKVEADDKKQKQKKQTEKNDNAEKTRDERNRKSKPTRERKPDNNKPSKSNEPQPFVENNANPSWNDFYYSQQQPVYPPYNTMVPIDPNTGFPMYQQQYMQPMYYTPDQQQQQQQPYHHDGQQHYRGNGRGTPYRGRGRGRGRGGNRDGNGNN